MFCAAAQAQQAAAPAEDSPANTLAPVTVTARRRAETQQQVPIGMTVQSGREISSVSAPTASNAGLARSAPNVSFVDSGGQNSNAFNIRGVGSLAPLSPDDTSVVLYSNDAPRSVYGAAPVLMDIERVEVLRGPQGTLFGRNTQGGAINIIAKQPVFKPEYALTTEAGSHGHWISEVVANQPFTPDLAGRIAIRSGADGGRVPNLATGRLDGRADVGAFRGTLLWTPDARTVVTLTGFADKQESAAPRFIWKQNPAFPQTSLAPQNTVRWQDSGASLKVEREFDGAVLTALATYQLSRSTQVFDLTDGLIYSALTRRPRAAFDVPGADLATLHFGEKSWQQELRLHSPTSSAIAWTAGVNNFGSDFSNDTTATASPAAFNFQTQNGIQANRIATRSSSAFGEATVPLTERLKGTLGLRYSRERKDAAFRFTGNGNRAVAAQFAQRGRVTDDFITGRVGLSYDWSDDLMTYASAARGHVSAGYPAVSVNTPTGKPETPFAASGSWTYEAGLKSQWLQRRMTLNAAVFLNNVKNGHLIVFDPSALLFAPATLDYRSKGAELELGASLGAALKLTGGVGYTDAELVNVPSGSATGATSGRQVPNAPRVSANAGLQFEAPASAMGLTGRWVGQLVWQHVGARAADVKGSFVLPAYSVVNLRLGWQHGPVELYTFAYNLMDKRYLVAGQAWGPSVSSVRVGQGRTVGLGATWKF